MVSSGLAKTFRCGCTDEGECGIGLKYLHCKRSDSVKVLDRVIVAEFGGETAAFDAFHPEGYVIEGRYVPISRLGHEHT
jgi:hypothetical protein